MVGLRAHRPLVQDVLRASTPGNGYGAPGSAALTVAADVANGPAAVLAGAVAIQLGVVAPAPAGPPQPS
ncbi:hypothetical protein [Streptomyces griseofuscus]|uniref:Uncharacterized protein n=2 Tax=Streptomyces griseofuscus TaxID=146922 RepID=A0A3R8QIE4_9ACTN|nr:hypothetical protein [Streptomyces griseofuscus]RRQ86806.1 hypothetical protein CQW44_13425 [Streptomyces griseofuscus]